MDSSNSPKKPALFLYISNTIPICPPCSNAFTAAANDPATAATAIPADDQSPTKAELKAAMPLGDIQATISGVFTAAFFLFISHARPLPTLSAERPHPHVFCSYVLLSLLGQFAIHLCFLISSVKEAEKHMPDECIEPDSDFHPNLVNTVSYMVSMMLQVATFAVNYMGHPFNQSVSENKPFLYALLAAVGFFTVITSDLFRDLNDWLKLVPLPAGMRDKLLAWAFLMFLCCYAWERLLRFMFPGKIPAWRKRQRLVAANLEKKKQV